MHDPVSEIHRDFVARRCLNLRSCRSQCGLLVDNGIRLVFHRAQYAPRLLDLIGAWREGSGIFRHRHSPPVFQVMIRVVLGPIVVVGVVDARSISPPRLPRRRYTLNPKQHLGRRAEWWRRRCHPRKSESSLGEPAGYHGDANVRY